MTDNVLLAARGLIHSYGRYTALCGIDVQLRHGEILGFLGLNGAGKSTTMQILSGAIAPDAGRVRVGGYDLHSAGRAAKQHIGYLPQSPPAYDDMQVDEYLVFCALAEGLPQEAAGDAAAVARGRCGLGDHGKRLIRHLSGGYRQRLGLAQAIVHEPRVLILDEPTNGLDPAQIREVHALLRELAHECSVLVSTHILAEVQTLASRVMILHHGRIVHDAAVSGEEGGVKVRFSTQPDVCQLHAVSGVQSAVSQADGTYLLRVNGDAIDALVAASVAGAWGLKELIPDYNTLEDLFLRLTGGGDTPGS